jgi:hypothetical protein
MRTLMKGLAAAGALAIAMTATPPTGRADRAKDGKPAKLTKSEMRSITAGNPPGAVNGLVNSNKNGSTTNNGPPPYPNR